MKRKKKVKVKKEKTTKERLQHIRKVLATLPPLQEKELREVLFNE